MHKIIKKIFIIASFINILNTQLFGVEIQEISMQEYNELYKIVNSNKYQVETIKKVLPRIKKLREYVLDRFGTEYVKNVINLEIEAIAIAYIFKAYEVEVVSNLHNLICFFSAHIIKIRVHPQGEYYQNGDFFKNEDLDDILNAIRSDYKLSDKEIFDDLKNQFALNGYNYKKIYLNFIPRLLRLCYSLKLTKSNPSLLNESYLLLFNFLFKYLR